MRAARRMRVSRELAERHYAEHAEKPFFGELVEFITSGPTLAFVLEGESAILVARTTIGATNPAEAAPGSIRGDLALAMPDTCAAVSLLALSRPSVNTTTARRRPSRTVIRSAVRATASNSDVAPNGTTFVMDAGS